MSSSLRIGSRQSVLLGILIWCVPAWAADWPQWRGPGRDGTVADWTAPKTWPKELTQRWKVRVGEGHSSPVVAGDRVYIQAREEDEEIIRCLDLRTGEEKWQKRYPAPYKMHPGAAGHGKGPKSTPTLSDGRLYTFSIHGILSCFDAKTGDVVWRKEFSRQFPNTSPLYGTAMSPLVVEGVCIAHVGGNDAGALTAFDIRDGSPKWKFDKDGPAYSSPILVNLAGRRQIVTMTQNFVMGLTFDKGEPLWKIPFCVAYSENAVTVLPYKDMLIYSGHSKPTAAIRLVQEGGGLAAREVWNNPDLPMHMSSPVLVGSRLFGMTHRSSGQVQCLDADTGQTLWASPERMGDNVAFIRAGAFILFQTTNADLVVLRPQANAYEPIAKYRVADTPTWAHPALMGRLLLIKDKYHLALFEIEG